MNGNFKATNQLRILFSTNNVGDKKLAAVFNTKLFKFHRIDMVKF